MFSYLRASVFLALVYYVFAKPEADPEPGFFSWVGGIASSIGSAVVHVFSAIKNATIGPSKPTPAKSATPTTLAPAAPKPAAPTPAATTPAATTPAAPTTAAPPVASIKKR